MKSTEFNYYGNIVASPFLFLSLGGKKHARIKRQMTDKMSPSLELSKCLKGAPVGDPTVRQNDLDSKRTEPLPRHIHEHRRLQVSEQGWNFFAFTKRATSLSQKGDPDMYRGHLKLTEESSIALNMGSGCHRPVTEWLS